VSEPSAAELAAGLARFATDVEGLGIEAAAGEMLDHFERSAMARAWMRAARRAGIPYSEARLRWRDPEDLAAEIAWDAYEALDRLRRCPSCGVDPDEIVDEAGVLLERGAWKVAYRTCAACSELHQADRTIGKEGREHGEHVRLLPRGPGEDLIDYG
jgi:hypothetical protein